MPQAPNPRTVGVATFKDMCDYMPAAPVVKIAEMLFFLLYGLLYGWNDFYNSDFLRYRIKPEFLSKSTLIIPIMTRNMT